MSFVPVGGTNRDKRGAFIPVGGSNRDKKAARAFCPCWCLQPGQKTHVPSAGPASCWTRNKSHLLSRTQRLSGQMAWNKGLFCSSVTGGCLHAEPQGRCISSSHSRSSPAPHIGGPGPEAEAGWSWTHGVWRSPELGTKRKQREQWLEFMQTTKFYCHYFVHPNRNWI